MGTYSAIILEGSLSVTFSVNVLNNAVPEEQECLMASINSLDWREGRPDQLRTDGSTLIVPIIDDDGECYTFPGL